MVTYQSASGMLVAVSFEFDGEEVLFGLTTTFNIKAPGTHQLFPYHTGGSVYNTWSTVLPSPGGLSYNGILLGDTDLLRNRIFSQLGLMATSVRLKLLLPDTLDVLMHKELWDFRLEAIGLRTDQVGNTTMGRGEVQATFRAMTDLPF